MSMKHHAFASKKVQRKTVAVAIALVVSGGMAGDVLAQQPSAPGFAVLEEIVVTARRRAESLQSVPIAVTAMSDDYLRVNNIVELTDLRAHVPSLGISVGGSSTNIPQVSLRGLRPDEVLITLDPAVPMYFSDVVMTPTHGTNLAMFDLANVQVLKGPQGTLFGRNSTGGAILIEPKRPGDEFGGYLETRLGNYALSTIEGAVDLPVSERVQFRLAGRTVDRDGYQNNVADNALRGSKKYWDEDSESARISMNVNFTDNLSNLLVVGYDKNEMLARVSTPVAFNPGASVGQLINMIHNGGAGIGGPAVDEAIERARHRSVHDIETDLRAKDKVENTVAVNTTTWEISDSLTVKNILGYRKVNYSGAKDDDGTALALFGSVVSPDSAVRHQVPNREIRAEQFSNEFQLIGSSFDDRLTWLTGLYWYDMDASEYAPTAVVNANPDWPAGPPPIPQLAPIWDMAQNGFLQNSPQGTVSNEAYGLFMEGTYSLTDRLDLTLGVRQSWDKRAITVSNERNGDCIVREGGSESAFLSNNACVRSESERFSSPSWRAVVDYQVTPDAMVYGSVSTGYRSGGFNLRGTDDATLTPYDEETVQTFELGTKADWQFSNGMSLRTNMALYLSKFDDIQKTQDVVDEAGALATNIVNAAEAEMKGLELEAFFNVTPNLELMAAYSYVDTEYKQWLKPTSDGGFYDSSGSDFLWIPKHSANAYIRYHLPINPAIGDISLMASLYWQGEMSVDEDVGINAQAYPEPIRSAFLATEYESSYSVVNLRADWRHIMGSSFDLGIWVENLRDEEYAVGGLTVEDSQGWASRVYGAPRTYGATVRWSF